MLKIIIYIISTGKQAAYNIIWYIHVFLILSCSKYGRNMFALLIKTYTWSDQYFDNAIKMHRNLSLEIEKFYESVIYDSIANRLKIS